MVEFSVRTALSQVETEWLSSHYGTSEEKDRKQQDVLCQGKEGGEKEGSMSI